MAKWIIDSSGRKVTSETALPRMHLQSALDVHWRMSRERERKPERERERSLSTVFPHQNHYATFLFRRYFNISLPGVPLPELMENWNLSLIGNCFEHFLPFCLNTFQSCFSYLIRSHEETEKKLIHTFGNTEWIRYIHLETQNEYIHLETWKATQLMCSANCMSCNVKNVSLWLHIIYTHTAVIPITTNNPLCQWSLVRVSMPDSKTGTTFISQQFFWYSSGFVLQLQWQECRELIG